MKAISITKLLAQKFGGKWQYDKKSHQWRADDNNRYVRYVLTGRDYEGEYTGESSLCMYFHDNSKSPEWVYL